MRAILLAGLLFASSQAMAEEKWVSIEGADAMTDQPYIYAAVESERYRGVSAAFTCDQDGMSLLINGDLWVDIVSHHYRWGTWRVDQGEVVEKQGLLLDYYGTQTAFSNAQRIAKAVARAKDRFVIKGNGTPLVFGVEGAKDAITTMLDQCREWGFITD